MFWTFAQQRWIAQIPLTPVTAVKVFGSGGWSKSSGLASRISIRKKENHDEFKWHQRFKTVPALSLVMAKGSLHFFCSLCELNNLLALHGWVEPVSARACIIPTIMKAFFCPVAVSLINSGLNCDWDDLNGCHWLVRRLVFVCTCTVNYVYIYLVVQC